ncbi:hypothetical protein HD806DRAFT_153180 [Xylariaceae sp. AK1471]|nr:hypothetical protein HD806DRAFT_153180 [Xylariaceae sp. AK1471]
MRQVYLTKLRSKIAYACPAWWIPPSEHVKRTWTMKQCDVKSLNQLQYVCLKLVSGARNRTPQRVIEKEVYVDPIEVFAHRLRVAHHARVLGSREFRDQQRLLGRISKESSKPKKTVRISKMSSKPKKTVRIQHPYHHVREEAWLVKKGSHATIQSIDDGYEAKARFIDLAREIMSQTQSMLGESHDLSKEAIDLLRNLSMGASELEQIAFNEMKAWQEAGLVSEVRTGALDATNPRFYAMARQLEERARPFAALSDLYGPVRDLERRARWYDPQKRKETINEYARTRATFKSRRIWLDVLSEWESRHTQSFSRSAKPLAHHGGWGPHNLKWYKGLSKAQCSLLIQCRTGWVGLNASSDMRHVGSYFQS